jgi:hypothetical protein
MTRLAFFAALAVAAAAVLGCGPAKELPDELPRGPEPSEQGPVVPKASEPAAAAYVKKAVKAFTGDRPELVAKGKVSRLALKGKMLLPAENQKAMGDATRTLAAVWPDRIQTKNDFQVQGQRMTVGTWVRRPTLTVMSGTVEVQVPNKVEYERNLVADAVGQLWMLFLVPVTDPKAVVFDLRSQTQTLQAGPPVPVQTLTLSFGDFPLYHLTFDAKTDALLRVEYTNLELGVRHVKQWTLAAHKTGPEGLLLPSKMECKLDNVVVEEWEAEKWEFPAAIPDEEFIPPQPK